MAKSKGTGSVQNRPIYSRISFLYQASALFGVQQDGRASQTGSQTSPEKPSLANPKQHADGHVKQTMSRRLLTELRSVSLKSQIRQSPAMKHTVCKFCDTLLIEGQTASSVVENKSKGGKKPWADVFVLTCKTCGGVKRFPVSAPRQKRRPLRAAETEVQEAAAETENLAEIPLPQANDGNDTDVPMANG